MKSLLHILILFVGTTLVLPSCRKEPFNPDLDGPTPMELEIPPFFPDMVVPADNPTTFQGVALGRRLFYETRLSGDNTQSCASCHAQSHGFTDNGKIFSVGIDGIEGDINSMPIVNLGWSAELFWNGRAAGLEEQAGQPVENPIEMHETWANVLTKLQGDESYRRDFLAAFGTEIITKELATKAIAQFERTLISADSEYDKYRRRQPHSMSASALRGMDIFFTEKGECFHCHGSELFTNNDYHNNGLDATLDSTNIGRRAVSGNPADHGKFRTPTLRNLGSTAPYMHDGRFQTLEEVIEHYSTGVRISNTLDPLIPRSGLNLTTQEKVDLLEFLQALNDPEFLTNPNFGPPIQ
jgi:cytochrome c peroxidase